MTFNPRPQEGIRHRKRIGEVSLDRGISLIRESVAQAKFAGCYIGFRALRKGRLYPSLRPVQWKDGRRRIMKILVRALVGLIIFVSQPGTVIVIGDLPQQEAGRLDQAGPCRSFFQRIGKSFPERIGCPAGIAYLVRAFGQTRVGLVEPARPCEVSCCSACIS